MKRLAIVLLVLAIAIGGMAIVQVNLVRDGSGLAQLLWHDDEAFLFLATGRGGWRVSYLWLQVSRFSMYGAATTDDRGGMTVFRITPDAVEKHDFDGARPPDLIAFDGYVSAGGARWTGDHFDTAERRPVPTVFAASPPQHFDDVNGWWKRSFFVTTNPRQVVEFSLAGQPARLILTFGDDIEAIDLQRSDRPVERIWTADHRTRWVGGAEYEAIFEK